MDQGIKYYPSHAWFNEKQANKLRDSLPAFSLSSDELDDASHGSEEFALLRQQYLSFYNIDFVDEFSELNIQHHLGSISSGGYTLACQSWRPQEAKNTVVLVHGYYDHMGIYQHITRFLLANGYAVLAFDLPGHGLSSGERASIESFDDYSRALADVMLAGELMPGDTYLLGQSTGCAAIMSYVLQCPKPAFEKVALLAPLIKPLGWNGGQWLFKLLNKRINTMPRRFAVNSHYKEFMQFLAELDVLQPRQLSVQWVGAMKAWIEKMEQTETRSEQALFVIQGTDDKTVDWEYNLPQIEEVFAKVKVELIEDGRHQLVNEAPRYREQVFSLLKAYFSA